MSVSNGNAADETTFNNAFMSRLSDTDTIGKVDLNEASSAAITDVQKTINDQRTDIDQNRTDIDSNDTELADHESRISTNETSVGLNNSHRTGDGSDHANVALNDAHRVSDGKDHSDVVLNNSHRVSTSNPHSVTASQVGNTTAQWNADQIQGVDVHTVAPTDGQILKYVSANSRYEAANESGGGGGLSIATITESQTSGTGPSGGSFVTGAWRTRVLNTEDDPDSIVVLASDVMTPISGTYLVLAWGLARATDNHQIRLQNTTDASTEQDGENAQSNVKSNTNATSSRLECIVSTDGTKDYELQHRCQTTGTFGQANSFGNNEIYAGVTWIKIG